MNNINITVGNQILLARRAKKMLQSELAETSGVSINTIRNIESGKFDAKIGTIAKLCEVLGINSIALGA